jgi:predicted transcriptional regulator
MSTMTIRVPDPLRRQLQSLSKRKKLPLSDLVRESLRRYVAVERLRALRRKALPYAKAQGYLTDEDVFRAVS